jgi:ABC-2 type transport system ATP-binding protein
MLLPGQIRARGVSRRFRVVHDRSLTLKETLIRRRRARYSELWALRDVDLDVSPGDAVAIVGRNGSGKSTLLKLLAGIVPPHEGVIQTGGTVASMLELGAGFHPDFTGRENVFMNGAIYGLSEREVSARLGEIIDFSELAEFIDMPVRTYSSGMQMRLAFAVASHVNPNILLLDEVLAVGDEAFQRKCLGRIHRFRNGGGTLVFVSHDPNAVETVCDRAILVENGEIVADGAPAVVLADYHRSLAATTSSIGAEITSPPPDGDVSSLGEEGPDEAPLSALGGWGSGAAVVGSISLVGTDGPSDSFVSGDPMSIVLTINSRERVVLPNVGISINTVDGRVVFGTSTRLTNLDLREIDGSATVTLTIDAIPLHEGRFEISTAIVSSDEATVFHWIDQAASFDVFSRLPGVGIVAIDGEWQAEA